MGMYTQVQFTMIVKPEFRKYTEVYTEGGWVDTDDPRFLEFSKDDRASFIPNGYDTFTPGGGWRIFDEETGEWDVSCSLKNYENTVEKFFELIPYFIESIKTLETFDENDDIHRVYQLIDNKVVKVNQYSEYDDGFVPESNLALITSDTQHLTISTEDSAESLEVDVPIKRVYGELDLETGTLTYHKPEGGTQ